MAANQSRGAVVARLLEGALSGEPDATGPFVKAMAPIVRYRVARALRRHGPHSGLDVRGDLPDLTQEVWAFLFEHECRALRSWSASGGSSLENFVGLIAYRRAVSLIRARSSSGAAAFGDPAASPELSVSTATPETRAESRELVRELLVRLGSTLSARDQVLFERLFVRDAPVDDLLDEGVKPSAVHTRKSRLARRARAVLDEIESAPAIVNRRDRQPR